MIRALRAFTGLLGLVVVAELLWMGPNFPLITCSLLPEMRCEGNPVGYGDLIFLRAATLVTFLLSLRLFRSQTVKADSESDSES
jgi:hypothetical protein|tara:strand:+ start:413 stop:664 length:252 start_codon:yes stop_codon:yes gene_type:complete